MHVIWYFKKVLKKEGGWNRGKGLGGGLKSEAKEIMARGTK